MLIWINNGREEMQVYDYEYVVYIFQGYCYGRLKH